MKKIVCELCECTEFTKEDGMFVCASCGTKYTAEEARALMREVDGEAPAVKSAANNQQLENTILLATSAYESGNNAEAEKYCNQAIVLDAACYKAWFIKAKAIGWQTTLGNNRMEESAHSFCKAIEFAPEEEKEDYKNKASDELKKLGLACISLRKKNFSNNPETDELNGFTNDVNVLLESLKVLLSHGNAVPIPSGFLEEVATEMNYAAVAALNMSRKAWDKVDHPSDKDLKTYIDWIVNIEKLLRRAIDLSDDDDDADVVRYRNLAIVLEEPIGKYSHERYWDDWSSSFKYRNNLSLTDEACNLRRKQAAEANEKADKLEKEVKEKKEAAERERIAKYWEDHPDEKAGFDKVIANNIEKLEEVNKELAEVEAAISEVDPNKATPTEADKLEISKQVNELNAQKSKLGLFAGKEKKALAEQIAALEAKYPALDAKIAEEKKALKAVADEKLQPLVEKKNALVEQKKEFEEIIYSARQCLANPPKE